MEKICASFLDGSMDAILGKLYCEPEEINTQRARYIKAIECFKALYGNRSIEIYSAPGRTEIGGNHTDHQNGRVLAAAINLDAIAVASKRDDNVIRISSEGYGEIEVDITSLGIVEAEYGTTNSLVKGTVAAVKELGYKTGGFDAYITSDVLSGSGLSSSAAYEVLIGNILSGMYNDGRIDEITLAQIGQKAENIYFGKPCGLLDQMTASVGGLINIDFKDKEKPKIKKVDVDFGKFEHSLCIVDTKGSHADLTDEYAAVSSEMKSVANIFGKEVLSEVDKEEFYSNINKIRAAVGDRAVLRAMHWYAENERVDAQVSALESGNFDKFKELIKASGDSSFKYLQNVYTTKNIREQNVSVALSLSDEILRGKGVSRVHGGGFAGTIQAFVPKEMVLEYKRRMEDVFGEGSCYVLHIRTVGGVRVV